MMNKISVKKIGYALLVLLLLCSAPVLLIYYIWTQDSSVDPLIVKFQLQTCVDKGALHFEKCAAKVSDFARESLEIREERINRWLYGIAGFLALVTWFFTALAILIAAGGFVGISIFNSLRQQAEKEVNEIKTVRIEAEEKFRETNKVLDEATERFNATNKVLGEVESLYEQMVDTKDELEGYMTNAQKDIETLNKDIEALKKKIKETSELHNKT